MDVVDLALGFGAGVATVPDLDGERVLDQRENWLTDFKAVSTMPGIGWVSALILSLRLMLPALSLRERGTESR